MRVFFFSLVHRAPSGCKVVAEEAVESSSACSGCTVAGRSSRDSMVRSVMKKRVRVASEEVGGGGGWVAVMAVGTASKMS